MTALIVGTLLALAALAYVLYPLFVEPASAQARPSTSQANPDEPAYAAASPSGTPATPSAVPDDVVEEEIRRARREAPTCSTCGPRPEGDAVYCSSCGEYLPGRCPGCGQRPTEPGSRFCANCGRTLAA